MTRPTRYSSSHLGGTAASLWLAFTPAAALAATGARVLAQGLNPWRRSGKHRHIGRPSGAGQRSPVGNLGRRAAKNLRQNPGRIRGRRLGRRTDAL